jgi:N4-gp56 family major capsid protein
MAINTTTSTASTTGLNKTFYERATLAFARTKFVHALYGLKKKIPLNSGKNIEWRRWKLFDPDDITGGLTEGVTPESMQFQQDVITATVAQYGAFVSLTDVLSKTAYDDVMKDSPVLLGEAVGTAVEWVTRDVMAAGTNVQYAGGKTARASVTAADKLTVDDVRKAVRSLKKAKARMFNGTENGGKARRPHFICICGPDATYDLQDDTLWQDVSKYANAEQIYSGELGRMFGVVFVESTEAKIFEGAGADSADVYATLVFGKEAYGIVDVNGEGAVQHIVHPFGSGGPDDALNQRASIAAKVPSYAAARLNEAWMVRIEHGATA